MNAWRLARTFPPLPAIALALALSGCGDDDSFHSGAGSYRFVDEIATPPFDAFLEPPTVAIDRETGALFAREGTHGRIFRVAESGSSATVIGHSNWTGIVAADGLLYAILNGQLVTFDEDGTRREARSFRDGPVILSPSFISPSAPPGHLLARVGDRAGVFDRQGKLAWWLPMSFSNRPHRLSDVAVGADGRIATLEPSRNLVEVRNAAGQLLATWPTSPRPQAITLAPDGQLLVLSESNGFLLEYFEFDGTSRRRLAVDSSTEGTVVQVEVGAFDTVVYVLDSFRVFVVRGNQSIGQFGHEFRTGPGEYGVREVDGRPDGGVVALDFDGALHHYSRNGTPVGVLIFPDATGGPYHSIIDFAYDRTFVGHFLEESSVLTQVLPDGTRIRSATLSDLRGVENGSYLSGLTLDSSGREIVVGRDQSGAFIARIAPELGPLAIQRFGTLTRPGGSPDAEPIRRLFPIANGGFLGLGHAGVYQFNARLDLVSAAPVTRFLRGGVIGWQPSFVVPDREGTGVLVLMSGERSLRLLHFTFDGDFLGNVPIEADSATGLVPTYIQAVGVNDAGELIVATGLGAIHRFRPVDDGE